MSLDEYYAEYARLAHQMQTGVEFSLAHDPRSGTPKHLRVGVNAAMSDHGALVELLIEKGVFTEEEYVKKMIKFMKREVETYEKQLSERLGVKTTLG